MHYAYIDEVWGPQEPISKSAGPSAYPSPPPPPKKSPSMEVVRQQRPDMDRSPQDPERNTMNNIAVYLESVYRTYGLDSLVRLLPEPVRETFRDETSRDVPKQQQQQNPVSIFSVIMFALIAFVAYDIVVVAK
jgi:hypothetical protein